MDKMSYKKSAIKKDLRRNNEWYSQVVENGLRNNSTMLSKH